MCIYTVKKQNNKKKRNSQGGGGVRNSTQRPKTRRLRLKRIRQKLTNIEACHFAYC